MTIHQLDKMIQLIWRVFESMEKMSVHINDWELGLFKQMLRYLQGWHWTKIAEQQLTS
jgi:hypothetical protein